MRWLLLLVLIGCSTHKSAGLSPQQRDTDGSAPVYEECDTFCLRPGDCEMSYNDDGICPAGFRCAFHFTCGSDGGTAD